MAVGNDVGPASRTIDAEGRFVTPGFVDAHAHSDALPLMSEPQPFKLLQGVTTEVVGNCGFSVAPLDDTSAATSRKRGATSSRASRSPRERSPTTWIASRRPDRRTTSRRSSATGRFASPRTARAASSRTMRSPSMCALAEEAFRAGAVGLSTGLIYVPATYAETDEIVALARIAARWRRPYATHMRDEGERLGEALDEAIEIGRRSGARVQISHCKAFGPENRGKSALLLDTLHRARAEGVDVRGDQYPYTASSTFLVTLLPSSGIRGRRRGAQGAVRRPGDAPRAAAGRDVGADDGRRHRDHRARRRVGDRPNGRGDRDRASARSVRRGLRAHRGGSRRHGRGARDARRRRRRDHARPVDRRRLGQRRADGRATPADVGLLPGVLRALRPRTLASSGGRRRSGKPRRRPRSSSTWRIAARCSPGRSPTSASSIPRRSRIRAATRSPTSPRWASITCCSAGRSSSTRATSPGSARATSSGRDELRAPWCRAISLRVAMLAPISWRVPPRHYGPWEQFVSLLTEGLVGARRGRHAVRRGRLA